MLNHSALTMSLLENIFMDFIDHNLIKFNSLLIGVNNLALIQLTPNELEALNVFLSLFHVIIGS